MSVLTLDNTNDLFFGMGQQSHLSGCEFYPPDLPGVSARLVGKNGLDCDLSINDALLI